MTSIAANVQSAMEAADTAVQQAPVEPTQGNVPAPASAQPMTMSMDDFVQGAMHVDGYVKVDSYGIHFDDQKRDKKETVEVLIDTNEVQPSQVIRFGNNPPTYYKTYDGVNCTQGGTWQESLQTAHQVDPKAKPYKSADIPMELVNDEGNGYEAGTRLGHSLSPTNQSAFASFWRELSKRGLVPSHTEATDGSKVKAKISYKERSKNGNSWGILTFEFLEQADD